MTSSNSDVTPVNGRIWAAAQKTLGSWSRTHKHQVGEAEIGEQLPLRDQQLQPVMVGLGKVGVLGDDLRHRRHVANLRPPPTVVGLEAKSRIARRRAEEERGDTSFVLKRRRSRRPQSAIRAERAQRAEQSNLWQNRLAVDLRRLRWPRVPASAAPAGRRARTTASVPTPDGR